MSTLIETEEKQVPNQDGHPAVFTEPVPPYNFYFTPEAIAARSTNPPDPATGKNIHWTSDPTVELPIKIGTRPGAPESVPPTTVIEVFKRIVSKYANEPALQVKRDGKWDVYTWRRYYQDCCRFAKACIALGMNRFDGGCIIGFNSPEWFIANNGIILAGGIATGIYTTNNVEATVYVAQHSDSVVAVAEDSTQAAKFLAGRDKLPKLKMIVQYTGSVAPGQTGVISWHDFLKLGEKVTDAALDERMNSQRPGHCCTLIYTSGTTGNPKAVMISHDNLTWTASAAIRAYGVTAGDRIVSYLPLSHIAAQIIDIHGAMAAAGFVSFAQPDALRGSLVSTLQEVRPTLFFGVPRVWEKIEEKMRAVGASNGAIKQALGSWAKSVGLAASWARLKGESLPWTYPIANYIVFENIKKALGLDQARVRTTSAAPISKETLEYFMSLDMILYEVYGMSECTGPHTINRPGYTTMFSVGKPFPGVYMRLDNPDKNGNGEIQMWGRHVFMGYMKAEDATRETIDNKGFMRTGDLGRTTPQGYLYITGRIKELLITAGGENVAPVLIEEAVKAESQVISNVMVVGDRRKYLVALITLRTDPDAEGNPTEKLTETVCNILKAEGINCTYGKTTTKDVKKDPAFLKYLDTVVARANKNVISQAQRVAKFAVLDQDFTLAAGDLTPTLKLRRRVVTEKHSALIESLYAENPAPAAGNPSKL